MTLQAPSPQPRVAVCVPAHGNPTSLTVLLGSLAVSDYPADRLHVVVCVDGPDEHLASVARSSGATTVVLPTNQGSYAARNAALEVVPADVEVVLFTDTDCVVTPGWITEHLLVLTSADASGGAVRLTTSTPPRPAEWVDASRHLRQQHFVEALGFAATCNLAVRRPVVDALRFDASLRSGGDFDFGQRLAAAGYRLAYAPEAVVEHPARRTAAATLRKVSRVAQGAAVNQSRGHLATARRDPRRTSSLSRAQREGLTHSRAWALRVRALDATCSCVYAWHVPSVILPALRRRLRLSA